MGHWLLGCGYIKYIKLISKLSFCDNHLQHYWYHQLPIASACILCNSANAIQQ
uniref:Uncharacterized protein n=1 Tax=Anguilla anguilla TaxID=7936 RepID=A0A0E9TZN9_ANGAN